MRYLIVLLALCVVVEAGPYKKGWNRASYAVVNNTQLKLAVQEGRVSPSKLKKRMKGYPNVTYRKSNDKKWVLFETEKAADNAHLKQRAAAEGIQYYTRTATQVRKMLAGTNWVQNVEMGE